MSTSCDTSGDESDDHRPEKFSDGVGRSYYECTFCKRGFTNAQALGGHMNIHRKDKLKAKQAFKQQHEEEFALSRKSNSNNTHNDQQVSTHQISSQQQDFDYPSSRAYVTFHQLFHLPSANPSYQFHVMDHHGYYRDFALHDANLSLRIGSPDYEERKEEHIEVSEVDLELRLGPNSTFR